MPVGGKFAGALTLPGFMARWELAVASAPTQAMRWLASLGTDAPAKFLKRVKRRRCDKRTLLRCLLLDADNEKAGETLFAKMECGLLAASRGGTGNKAKAAKHAAGRVGVVCVPTIDEMQGTSLDPDDDAEDAAALAAQGPFLAVVRVSNAQDEAEHLARSSFYDVVSVVVNGMDKAAAEERIAAVAAAAKRSSLPVLPCTVGTVQPERPGDGGGHNDTAIDPVRNHLFSGECLTAIAKPSAATDGEYANPCVGVHCRV